MVKYNFKFFPIFNVKILIMDIIFSADDFGKNTLVNENILKLVRKKKIDRVSVMVNGHFSDEEKKQLIKAKVKLDLHLETKNYFYKEGNRGFNFLWVYYLGRDDIIDKEEQVGTGGSRPAHTQPVRKRIWPISVEEVRKDWQAQIEKFIKIFGQKPDGLSSHEHVHFFPPYFSLFLDLCQESKINFVRFGGKGIKNQYSPIGLILAFLNQINRRKFKRFQSKYLRLKSTDYLMSLDWLKNPVEYSKRMAKIAEKNQKKSIELVCHLDKQKEYEFLKNMKK